MGNKPLFVVTVNFEIPEREEEWNRWYSTKHVPDVLKCPGIISGNRYRAVDPQPGQAKYLAIYEFESEVVIEKAMSSPEMEFAVKDWFENWPEGTWSVPSGMARIYKHIGP